MAKDTLEVEILADGSLKILTDKISMPNHANAEAFLLDLARGMGGDTTRTKRKHTHTHTHTHGKEVHRH